MDKIDEWLYDFSRRIQLRNSRPKIFKRDDVSDYARESGHDFFQYQFDKGIRGEANVFHLLEAMPYYTKIMTNLYIPTEKGTTEIDIVLIAPWGIYVIESKNYSGKIYGDQKYRNWHHYLGGKKYEFLNPIIQNQLYIDALEKVLPNLTLHSLIIFGNKTELKKLSVDKDQVILVYELEDYMEKRSKNVIYSQKNIDTIYQYLQQYAYKSDEEKQAHITNLKRRQQN